MVIVSPEPFVMANVGAFPLTNKRISPASPTVAPASVTATPASLPTEVKDELTIPDDNVVPLNVFAAAVTVMSCDPLNCTPFIALPGANVLACAASPLKVKPCILLATRL